MKLQRCNEDRVLNSIKEYLKLNEEKKGIYSYSKFWTVSKVKLTFVSLQQNMSTTENNMPSTWGKVFCSWEKLCFLNDANFSNLYYLGLSQTVILFLFFIPKSCCEFAVVGIYSWSQAYRLFVFFKWESYEMLNADTRQDLLRVL